jgi:hypothetical protein
MLSLIFWVFAVWLGFMGLILVFGVLQAAGMALATFLDWTDKKTNALFSSVKAGIMVRVRGPTVAHVSKLYSGPILLDMGILVCLLVASITLCR